MDHEGMKWLASGLLLLGISSAGCVTTHLEFDRMTGSAFPAAQTVDGDQVTLTSIYANAGHVLVVNEDETDIPALGGEDLIDEDCITNAELDALETDHRASQVEAASFECGWGWFRTTCTRYHLYGVVVNHYGTNSSGTSCDTGLLGRMWSTSKRQAFAMYYKNSTVNGNPKKYLRSAAHEIGHAYNLHHEDGDGSTTIMNQTGVVGDSFVYEFSDTSQTHLKEHPAQCKFPGTGSFYSVHPDHTLHSYVSATCSD
ncbi:hypothetical protein [Candidatus Nitrospira bockiana]